MESGQVQKRLPEFSGEKAGRIHDEIVKALRGLIDADYKSPISEDFKGAYSSILGLFTRYQTEVLSFNKKNATCSDGCAACCFHWVEDVNSFECEIIAEYIRCNFPDKINTILKTIKKDEKLIVELERITNIKMDEAEKELRENNSEFDNIDVLLSSFYQFKRPCPLLDKNNRCIVYPVRPLTCRIYLSFSDPVKCEPEYINESEIHTYLLDMEEEANELFDELHFKYDRFGGDSSLRTLLAKYLDR